MILKNEQQAQRIRRRAEQLVTIPDCPRTEAAIDALAEDLVQMCADEKELDWLVHDARHKWTKWLGIPGLRDLLEAKRHPPAVPLERQVLDFGPRPPVNCTICNDQGWLAHNNQAVWCTCEMARQTRAELPDFMERLNRKRIVKLPTPIDRKPITEADLELAFEDRQNRIARIIADARATLANPAASRDQKEIAREILSGLGVKDEEAS